VLLEAASMPSAPDAVLFSGPSRWVGAAIDVLIGLALIAGSKGVIPWAIVRTVLGLIILTAIQAFRDPFLAVMQLTVSCSLLLLLIGDASKPRIATGSAFFGTYALICVIGLSATVTGRNPIAALILRLSGSIEGEPAGVVTGADSHYRLHAPPDRWYLRTAKAAGKDNPLADRWLI